MKTYLFAVAVIAIALCAQVPAQSNDESSNAAPSQTPPAKQKVHVTPSVVRAAQQKLDDAGYQSGTPDGKMGPKTRAAIRKYQQDQNLAVTGSLDESTLSKLDVGGNQTIATAPGDIKSGAKAAGHAIKDKHPVAAAKDLGKGIGEAGKAVGEGTKSDIVGEKDKIEHKKTEHEKSDDNAPPK